MTLTVPGEHPNTNFIHLAPVMAPTASKLPVGTLAVVSLALLTNIRLTPSRCQWITSTMSLDMNPITAVSSTISTGSTRHTIGQEGL